MSRTFKQLRLDRIDVVDRPANPHSRIVICKRDVDKSELDAETRNALPDHAFAYIGEDGQRHLPYKHADGSVDKNHLRNALARLNQTDISPAAKAQAKKKLLAAAREAGVGDHTEKAEGMRVGNHKCEDCGAEFDTAAELKTHEKNEHGIGKRDGKAGNEDPKGHRPRDPDVEEENVEDDDIDEDEAGHKAEGRRGRTQGERTGQDREARSSRRLEKRDMQEIEIAKREAAEAKAEVLKLRQEREREVFIRKAADFKAYGPADTLAGILQKMSHALSPTEMQFIEKRLLSVQKVAEEGKLFAELGVAGEAVADTPWSQIQKAVSDTVQKSGNSITREVAMTQFLQTEAGKRLYEQYTQTMPGMAPGSGREE